MTTREDQITSSTFLLLSARRLGGVSAHAGSLSWNPQAGWISRDDAEHISMFAAGTWDCGRAAHSANGGPVGESVDSSDMCAQTITVITRTGLSCLHLLVSWPYWV